MADWLRGLVLAWAELHPGLGGEGTLDLTAVDFRHTVDNMRTRHKGDFREVLPHAVEETPVQQQDLPLAVRYPGQHGARRR
jgi:hypothetical protein